MEIQEQLQEILSPEFKVLGIHGINHKPHQYMIGPKHIAAANIYLNEEVCRKIQCAHPGCHETYDNHTSDKVCFLQLTKNFTQDEVNI